MNERISVATRLLVAVTWYVLNTIALRVTPSTSQSRPLWFSFFDNLFLALLAAMAVGFLIGRRWALYASLAAGCLAALFGGLCLWVGHHPYGTWWPLQMLCYVGILCVTGFALDRRFEQL